MPPFPLPSPAAAQVADFLAQSTQLGTLSPDHQRELVAVATLRSFSAGEEIASQGSTLEAFYLVAEGRVKMIRDLPNGRRLLLSLFGPGQLVGTVDALGGAPSPNGLIALSDTTCVEIRRDALLACLERRSDLAVSLLVTLVPHLSECKQCIVELAALRVEARLARLLMRLAANIGQHRPQGVFLPVVLPRQDLADMTGTTIETCIRVMSRWRKEGVVETLDDGFLITEPALLRQLSEG